MSAALKIYAAAGHTPGSRTLLGATLQMEELRRGLWSSPGLSCGAGTRSVCQFPGPERSSQCV